MISVITITFNNYVELVETLASIKDIPNIQSIVINGGSCEKTKTFLSTFSGISLTEKDRGISDAFNKGVKLATGDGIMFLNSGDILIDKNYIDWVQNLFDSKPDINFTYSDIIFKDSDLGHILIDAKDSEHRSLARGMPYPHQSMIIRKELMNRVGEFDESFRLAMDFDLILRMSQFKSKGSYYNRATVLMDGNGVSSKNDLNAIREVYKALVKNKMITLKIQIRVIISLLIYFIKKLFSFLGLSFIWIFIKKIKYKTLKDIKETSAI